jgi:hypothetical protein
MKLAAALCTFIGLVQYFLSHNLFGLVWVAAAVILFLVDRHYET